MCEKSTRSCSNRRRSADILCTAGLTVHCGRWIPTCNDSFSKLFLQNCILPRVVMTAPDSVYCARYCSCSTALQLLLRSFGLGLLRCFTKVRQTTFSHSNLLLISSAVFTPSSTSVLRQRLADSAGECMLVCCLLTAACRAAFCWRCSRCCKTGIPTTRCTRSSARISLVSPPNSMIQIRSEQQQKSTRTYLQNGIGGLQG